MAFMFDHSGGDFGSTGLEARAPRALRGAENANGELSDRYKPRSARPLD